MTGDEAFNNKVIAFAKSKGWNGGWSGDATVTVLTNERVSGYSEYTITSSWEEITVIVQDPWADPFVESFDNEEEPGYGDERKSAMTKLLEALDSVTP